MAVIFFYDPFPISGIGLIQVFERMGINLVCKPLLDFESMKIMAQSTDPDLIILSINTSIRSDAISLLDECSQFSAGAPIILFDEAHSVDLMNSWSRYNIHGYLAKCEPISVLLQCIQVTLDGGKYLSPQGWNRYFRANGDDGSGIRRLGLKEFEIAWYLSDGKSTSWIAERMGRARSTVSTMKKRIFDKMNVSNVVDLSRKFNRAISE